MKICYLQQKKPQIFVIFRQECPERKRTQSPWGRVLGVLKIKKGRRNSLTSDIIYVVKQFNIFKWWRCFITKLLRDDFCMIPWFEKVDNILSFFYSLLYSSNYSSLHQSKRLIFYQFEFCFFFIWNRFDVQWHFASSVLKSYVNRI